MENNQPFDYTSVSGFINGRLFVNTALKAVKLGTSWLKKDIYAFGMGDGDGHIVFSQRGSSSGDSVRAMLEWTEAMGMAAENGGSVSGCNLKNFFKKMKVTVLPCLNPDGLELAAHGIENNNPFAERLSKINPSGDYRDWKANARGIDIRRNFNSDWFESKLEERRARLLFPAPYGFGGEYPESEFETIALCGIVKTISPSLLITLDSGENIIEGFYLHTEANAYHYRRAAEIVAAMAGLSCRDAADESRRGSPEGWFSALFERPALRVSLTDMSKASEVFTLLAILIN